MGQLRRTSLADRDIVGIVSHIAGDNLSAAENWLVELERLCQLLAAHPLMSEEVDVKQLGHVRRRSFGNYIIYYRPLPNGAEILRVIHGARDQDKLV